MSEHTRSGDLAHALGNLTCSGDPELERALTRSEQALVTELMGRL